ncbi:alpha-ketoacid dehydrogenase subunit beta [Candidatus Woesearchaeota archaeon]|nr:alpha-ketoacid dehydrogenase subunit beta [Candidatus Woesearchaeota archaeon]
MTVMTILQAVTAALDQELKRDKAVLVMGEDVGRNGGVFRATDGLWKKYGGKRVVDTPLCESGIVATAIGMAVVGLKPVCEIQFSGFIYDAFEHLASHAARVRHRSMGAFSCPLVVRSPYGGGIRALEHHSESMESIYVHTPGLKVVIPSTPYDAKGLLAAAIRDPDPVVFLEPKRIYRSVKQEVPDDDFVLPLGKAKVVQSGSQVTVVSYGATMKTVREAVIGLDVSCELIDLRTLWPLDEATLLDSVRKTGRCVVVHEAARTLGMGAEVVAVINEKAIYDLESPVVRVTGYDTPIPYYQLENNYIPSKERIKDAVNRVLKG